MSGNAANQISNEVAKQVLGPTKVEIGVVHITVNPDASLEYDKTKDGWECLSDAKEPTGELSLELVEFLEQGETYISGEELVKRTEKLLGQRHAEALLRNQALIPEEWREYYLVFLGSVLQAPPHGSRSVPYLYWDSERWCLDFDWLKDGFGSCDRLVASRK